MCEDARVEMVEFFAGISMNLFFALTTRDVIETINNYPIEWVILSVNGIQDFSMIRLIEERHSWIKVIVLAERELLNDVWLLRKENLTFMPAPLRLMDLKEKMTA